MVRALSVFGCLACSIAYRTHEGSFPTDVWEEVTQVTCDQLEDRAKERMGQYRGSCAVGAGDMDSGAAGFALLRSGADKLCKCTAIDLDQLREDRAAIKEQDCDAGIFGPVGEMDRIYDDCKKGTLDMSQFKDGGGKLEEIDEKPAEAENTMSSEDVATVSSVGAESRPEYTFSGPIRFTSVGGDTNIGGSTEYCLTVMDDAVSTPGTEVYGSACEPGNNAQVWYYDMNDQYKSDGQGQLRVGPELLCLEQQDDNLVLADCAQTNTQGWIWMKGAGSSRMVKNKRSHKCFGLRYATDSGDGKKVTSWPCKRDKNQAVNLCNKDSKEGCAGYSW